MAVLWRLRARTSTTQPPVRGVKRLEDQPTLDELHKKLHRYFDVGTAYTMIAGLLNVLAIYDAWGGPVIAESRRKEEDEPAKPETGSGEPGK